MGNTNYTETASMTCRRCGAQLDENNAWERSDGVSVYCADCEEAIYEQLSQETGYSLGLYYTCIKFDVPCEPLLISSDFATDSFEGAGRRWNWYLNKLVEEDKYTKKGGEIRTFADGVTNILKIFGKNFTEKDFGEYVRHELERLSKLPGTPVQREQWGMGYTSAEYDELDRQYQNRLASYKGWTITPQMEDTLIKVVKWNLQVDKLMAQNKYKEASSIQSMVEKLLASENMRKKDERPTEQMRIDALVEYLERAGLMNNGMLLSYDETVKALWDNFIGKRKYDYTIDSCDAMILSIVNAGRKNDGLDPLLSLPKDLMVVDERGEFATEASAQEIENMRYVGMMKESNAAPTKKKKTTKGGKK